MILTDFKTNFKKFTASSRAFQAVLDSIYESEEGGVPIPASMKKIYEGCAKATFEAFVIFNEIIPNQLQDIMRASRLVNLRHEFTSTETLQFFDQHFHQKNFTQTSEYIKSMTLLTMSRQNNALTLKHEVKTWARAAKEKQAITEVIPSASRSKPASRL